MTDYNRYDLFNSIFEYNPQSPTGLVWKIETGCKNPKDKKYPGDIAGSIKGRHATVNYKGETYYTHRVVYVLHNKNIDDNIVIDHINGNAFDNSIENLRAVTQSINARNRVKSSNNTTGTTWVHLRTSGKSKNGHPVLCYVVQWTEGNGKRKIKSFSVFKHGLLPAYSMAVKFANEKLIELHNNGENYTLNHGK